MTLWKDILNSSITTAEELAEHLPADPEIIRQVIEHYPLRINPYYLSLIRFPGDPFWKQSVPDISELRDDMGSDDPLHEEDQSPVKNLIHRYPDRVVMLVSNQCPVFCRFCMRKRRLLKPGITHETVSEGVRYIRGHDGIRDVILSGGEPLLLDDDVLSDILHGIRSIPHVEIIRIHTRVPCTLPQRITPELANILKQFHPIFINTHFNHPDEITDAAASACRLLADAGIPLGSQTVLLRGVNDDPDIMKRLMQKLLTVRVKPYYLHQPDYVKGTFHFHAPPAKGLAVMKHLSGFTSGMCVPRYMIDLPGGGGKISVLPDDCIEKSENRWLIKNYQGKIYEYPLPDENLTAFP